MDGVLLVDKPAGPTSHDVVAAVRRAVRAAAPEGATRRRHGPRVGHAGTLDPFATGLLIVLLGRATRLQRLYMALPKRYETVARLGASSSTGDPEGEIVETGRFPPDPPSLPTGTVRQRPPAHSAVRVDGERAYRRARRGEVVEMPERTVEVMRFEQLWREGPRAAFAIECSSGTYVRSLIADLRDAYCLSLRRTAIGPFTVQGAHSVPAGPLDGAWVLELEAALRFLPRIELDEGQARLASTGRPVSVDGPPGAGPVLLSDEQGAVAVAERTPAGLLRAVIGLRG